ncbi:MAG: ribbon-helix-helix protein, CopG family [Gemmatimonadetes bacterium]|nr:ribbon-helix-helix protein, CopG family [Gemmatimonadota bacterium]
MSKSKRSAVREPIQVYLTGAERARLDRLARELGVSRAEVLRRGLDTLAGSGRAQDYDPLDDLVGAFDAPGAPRDLAEEHDRYLAEDLEAEWHRPKRKRSS